MSKEDFFIEQVSTLSKRTRDIIDSQNITCDSIVKFKKIDLLRLRNCGPKSIREILELAERLSQMFPEVTAEDVKDPKDRNDFDEFDGSVRAKRLLKTEGILNFEDLKKEAETNFANIRQLQNVGRKTVDEIKALYAVMRPMYEQTKTMSVESETECQSNGKFDGIGIDSLEFLDSSEKEFIKDFYGERQYYPMFYILFTYLVRSRNRNVQIKNAYYGLLGNYCDISELSKRHHLTSARIRTIVFHYDPLSSEDVSNWYNPNYFKKYNLGDLNILTEESTNFIEIQNLEKLPFNFSIFCYLCCLITKKHSAVYFRKNSQGLIRKCNPANSFQWTFGIPLCATNFNFQSAINYIQSRHAISCRKNDECIDLSKLCEDTKYWKDVTTAETIIICRDFISNFVSSILNLKVTDGCIIETASIIDVKKFAMDYIQSKNSPVHLSELYAALKNTYPDIKYTDFNQIRPFLSDRKIFTVIGRKSLYSLVGNSVYDGSQSQLILDILKAAPTPLSKKNIYDRATILRPDSHKRSIVSIIRSLIVDNQIIEYSDGRIGLIKQSEELINSLDYEDDVKNVERLKSFITANHRLPFMDNEEERKLLYWYYHTDISNKPLTPSTKTSFERLKAEVLVSHIPSNEDEFSFYQITCKYLDYVRRNTALVPNSVNRKLYCWFKNSLIRYREWDDFRNWHFTQLLSAIKLLGVEIKTQ